MYVHKKAEKIKGALDAPTIRQVEYLIKQINLLVYHCDFHFDVLMPNNENDDLITWPGRLMKKVVLKGLSL